MQSRLHFRSDLFRGRYVVALAVAAGVSRAPRRFLVPDILFILVLQFGVFFEGLFQYTGAYRALERIAEANQEEHQVRSARTPSYPVLLDNLEPSTRYLHVTNTQFVYRFVNILQTTPPHRLSPSR